MIIRGSTPTHTFTLPADIDLSDAVAICIVYSQNEKVLFECGTDRCAVNKNVICVRLTSDETLMFDCSVHYDSLNGRYMPYPVEIQVGFKKFNGNDTDKMWSNIITTTVERCLKEDGEI